MALSRWNEVTNSCSNIKASIDFDEENMWLQLPSLDRAADRAQHKRKNLMVSFLSCRMPLRC